MIWIDRRAWYAAARSALTALQRGGPRAMSIALTDSRRTLRFAHALIAHRSATLPDIPGVACAIASDGAIQIEAPDMAGFHRGLGAVSAALRMFQLEFLRRMALGRLSEAYGFAFLELDCWFAAADLAPVAEAMIRGGEDKGALEAFCEGVNCAQEQGLADCAEHRLFGLRPPRWTPRDVALCYLAVAAQFERFELGTTRRAAASNLWYRPRPQAHLCCDIHLPLAFPTPILPVRARVNGSELAAGILAGTPLPLAGCTMRCVWGVASLPLRTCRVFAPGPPAAGATHGRRDVAIPVLHTGNVALEIETRSLLSGLSARRYRAFEGWTPLTVSTLGTVDHSVWRLLQLYDAPCAAQAAQRLKRMTIPPLIVMIGDAEGRAALCARGMALSGGTRPKPVFVDRVTLLETPSDPLVYANNAPEDPLWRWEGVQNDYDDGWRQRRIAQLLRTAPTGIESSFETIARDCHTGPLIWYRDLLIEATARHGYCATWLLRQLLHRWSGEAVAASRAVAPLLFVRDRLCAAYGGEEQVRAAYESSTPQDRTLVLAAAREALRAVPARLLLRSWGRVNALRLRHPLASVLPRLELLLGPLPLAQAGCLETVLVAAPDYGTALRFAAAAGNPRGARLHWPGPLSGRP
jgi:acyl-homoserine lactone acylase PvdQ